MTLFFCLLLVNCHSSSSGPHLEKISCKYFVTAYYEKNFFGNNVIYDINISRRLTENNIKAMFCKICFRNIRGRVQRNIFDKISCKYISITINTIYAKPNNF